MPEGNQTRKALKEKLDNAQSDFNTAVRRLTYEFELAEAEARYQNAIQECEKLKEGPDPKDVTIAQARLENASATLASAKAKLEDLEIRGLFAGIIAEVYVRAGEWVSPGQPVILLGDLDNLRVETTDLNEIDVARVDLGEHVKVTFDALPDIIVEGTVILISPKAAEGAGVNYPVLVELSEIPEKIRWGMTAFVDIYVEE